MSDSSISEQKVKYVTKVFRDVALRRAKSATLQSEPINIGIVSPVSRSSQALPRSSQALPRSSNHISITVMDTKALQNVARNNVARNNVARNNVARNNVSRNNVSRNNVSRNNIAIYKPSNVVNELKKNLLEATVLAQPKYTGKMQITSANCAFSVIKGIFYKFQIDEYADPLINEVIFLKAINAKQKQIENEQEKIFPEYVDHFIVNLKKIGYGISKVLATNALSNPISLEDYIDVIRGRSDLVDKLLKLLIKTFSTYETFAKSCGFIHCDMHMGNIQLDELGDNYNGYDITENTRCTIIDFGRCYMNNEVDLYKQEPAISFTKFNLKQNLKNTDPFDNPSFLRLSNLDNETHDGYLCDVGHVAFNLMREQILEPYIIPNSTEYYFNISYIRGKGERLNIINFEKLAGLLKDGDVFKRGIAWYSCYLYACALAIINKSDYDSVFKSPAFDQRASIIDKNLNLEVDISYALCFLFNPNGMIEPSSFNIVDEVSNKIMTKTFELWSKLQTSKNVGAKGGNKRAMLGGVKSIVEPKIVGEWRSDYMFRKYRGMSKVSIAVDMLVKGTTEFKKKVLKNLALENMYVTDIDDEKKRKTTFDLVYDQIANEICRPNTLCTQEANQTISKISKLKAMHVLESTGGKPSLAASNRTWVVRVEKNTNRKYIRKANVRWYLDENRGKYRYADKDQKTIFIRSG